MRKEPVIPSINKADSIYRTIMTWPKASERLNDDDMSGMPSKEIKNKLNLLFSCLTQFVNILNKYYSIFRQWRSQGGQGGWAPSRKVWAPPRKFGNSQRNKKIVRYERFFGGSAPSRVFFRGWAPPRTFFWLRHCFQTIWL